MFDHFIMDRLKGPMHCVAQKVDTCGVSANSLTLIGFCFGLLAAVTIGCEHYLLGLLAILISRFFDALDGAVARIGGNSDRGAYLDTVCDFIFYALVVLAFAVADPLKNALAAAVLLAAFMGTSTSFLVFAIMAERNGIACKNFPQKGYYYLGGLTEGFETIVFFICFCLFPGAFSFLALFFAMLCLMTTGMRIYYAYRILS